MSYLKLVLIYIVIPTLFYPVYFLVANTVDSIFGDQQLINWLTFESRLMLLKTFLSDWLNALPIMFGVFYFLILPVNYLLAKINFSNVLFVALVCGLFVCVLTFIAGFRGAGLAVNFLSAFMFVLFYAASVKSIRVLSNEK